MNVQELINKLRGLSPEARVYADVSGPFVSVEKVKHAGNAVVLCGEESED